MKAQRGSRGIPLLFSLTYAINCVGGQRHDPAALPPEKISGTHCVGDWVDPRAGQDGCGKYTRDSIPEPGNPYVCECRVINFSDNYRLPLSVGSFIILTQLTRPTVQKRGKK
jgi:hypothetical protein